jgi:hypothetical protein
VTAQSVQIDSYALYDLFDWWPYFFAHLSPNCFSSCCYPCLLDQVFKNQPSDLMFDGDCGGKLEFSSKPMRVHCYSSGYLGESICSDLT